MGFKDPHEEGPDAITICIIVAVLAMLLSVGWAFEQRDACERFGADHDVETRYVYGQCRAYFPDGHVEVAEQ